jgi:hypothetical protein
VLIGFQRAFSFFENQKLFLKARLEERAGMVPSEAPLSGAKRGERATKASEKSSLGI